MLEEPAMEILAVEFGENYQVMDITYVERRNLGEFAFKREVVTVAGDLFDDEDKHDLKDAVEFFQALVDKALVHIRETSK